MEIVNYKKLNSHAVINGMCLISENENPLSVNIPKVITTEDKQLVYISRQLLPGYKEEGNKPLKFYKQVCIYAFNKNELKLFSEFERKSYLESLEDIEILGFLDLKIPVIMLETKSNSLAVDTPQDKVIVEIELKKKSSILEK